MTVCSTEVFFPFITCLVFKCRAACHSVTPSSVYIWELLIYKRWNALLRVIAPHIVEDYSFLLWLLLTWLVLSLINGFSSRSSNLLKSFKYFNRVGWMNLREFVPNSFSQGQIMLCQRELTRQCFLGACVVGLPCPSGCSPYNSWRVIIWFADQSMRCQYKP